MSSAVFLNVLYRPWVVSREEAMNSRVVVQQLRTRGDRTLCGRMERENHYSQLNGDSDDLELSWITSIVRLSNPAHCQSVSYKQTDFVIDTPYDR